MIPESHAKLTKGKAQLVFGVDVEGMQPGDEILMKLHLAFLSKAWQKYLLEPILHSVN